MTCVDFKRLLQVPVGEDTAAERVAWVSHLYRCAGCAQLFRDLIPPSLTPEELTDAERRVGAVLESDLEDPEVLEQLLASGIGR